MSYNTPEENSAEPRTQLPGETVQDMWARVNADEWQRADRARTKKFLQPDVRNIYQEQYDHEQAQQQKTSAAKDPGQKSFILAHPQQYVRNGRNVHTEMYPRAMRDICV